MRIFCAVRHALDPRQFYGALWSANFYPALRQLGHEIVESQVDLYPASRFMDAPKPFTPREIALRGELTRQVIDEVRRAHRQAPLDLFLSYFYDAHFDPAGFDELHALGIPTVNFYCNSVHQFELVAEVSARAQFAWHAERQARENYLRVGANPIWVQMGADPDVYRPVAGVERQPRACFIGQRYADRDRLAARLLLDQVPLDLYGGGWGSAPASAGNGTAPLPTEYLGRTISRPGSLASYRKEIKKLVKRDGLVGGLRRVGRQLRYRRETRRFTPLLTSAARGVADDLNRTMAAYELVLNFSNVWSDGRPGSPLVPHVRLRDFEAPMARAAYLTGYSEELAEFYELGREVDTYRGPDELVEKARFYLKHPRQAEALREAGYQRARADHTWVRRFEQLFAAIGITPTALTAASRLAQGDSRMRTFALGATGSASAGAESSSDVAKPTARKPPLRRALAEPVAPSSSAHPKIGQ